MKASCSLPMIGMLLALLLAPSSASFQGVVTASSSGDTADSSLDQGGIPVGTEDRILKSKSKNNKKNKEIVTKKEKGKKNQKKVKNDNNVSPVQRDPRCDEIDALESTDKIKCTDDCSDTYLACTNGEVIELPLEEGTKCYENGIVRIDEGNCVVTKEGVLSFDFLDACVNYPELEFCASSPNDNEGPYAGVILREGSWYFKDKVVYAYIGTYDEETMTKGWDIFINIRFGHDKEVGRSRTIVVSMDYGTTRVTKWWEMDQLDMINGEVSLKYNCKSEPSEEPITILIKKIIKNPNFIIGAGVEEISEASVSYTAAWSGRAGELGKEFMDNGGAVDAGHDEDKIVKILFQPANLTREELCDEYPEVCEEEKNSAPVLKPTLVFDEILEWDLREMLDADDTPPTKLIEEIRGLLRDYSDPHTCKQDIDQIDNGVTDVSTPISNRGTLLVGTASEAFDETEVPVVDGSILHAFDNTKKPDLWVAKDLSDLTKKGIKVDLKNVTKARDQLSEFVTEDTQKDVFNDLMKLVLGDGPKLPESKELFDDLVSLNETLTEIYDFNTDMETDLVKVWGWLLKIEKVPGILKKIDSTLNILDKVLKLVGLIKQIKFITKAVRKAVDRIRTTIIKRAITKTTQVNTKLVKPNKPRLKTLLLRNEKLREVTAKANWVTANILIPPLELTGKCAATNRGAGKVNQVIRPLKNAVQTTKDVMEDLRDTISDVLSVISYPMNLFDKLYEVIKSAYDSFNVLDTILSPFRAALNFRVTLSLPGPFCSFQKVLQIPYPCGIKYCEVCVFGCFNVPCGVKFCTKRTVITIPTFCWKTWSFTVGDVLNAISGVMDFIFAPLNLLVDKILDALPIPDIPIPGLNINFAELENLLSIDLNNIFNLPDLSLGCFGDLADQDFSPLVEAVQKGGIDYGFVKSVLSASSGCIPTFDPICSSADL